MQSDGPDGWLRGHLIHHCYPTLDDYIEHMNRYSTIAAQALVASGRPAGRALLALAGLECAPEPRRNLPL